MCLILFSYKTHKKYKLILAANRDEFYARPTLPMQWWKNREGILAGIDEKKQGTWMGIHKNGRFAALTNYRQLPITQKYESSRGFLVSEYLGSEITRKNYMVYLKDHVDDYDGYNLIFGDMNQLSYFCNKGAVNKELKPGLYGLSNHLLDTEWPKVVGSKDRMKSIIDSDEIDANSLFKMMKNGDLADDSALPDTGIGLEYERMLSAAFIESPEYGTRCTTVLMVDWENNVTFEERSYVPKADNKFQFTIG